MTTKRLEMRVSRITKNTIRLAANLCSMTLTDFVINAAYEKAMKIIKEKKLLDKATKDKRA